MNNIFTRWTWFPLELPLNQGGFHCYLCSAVASVVGPVDVSADDEDHKGGSYTNKWISH